MSAEAFAADLTHLTPTQRRIWDLLQDLHGEGATFLFSTLVKTPEGNRSLTFWNNAGPLFSGHPDQAPPLSGPGVPSSPGSHGERAAG